MSQGVSQGKVIKHVIIGLRTTKGTKQLKLDPSIYDGLQKEKVAVGDVIYIEANSGAVRRVGRCDSYATEYDLEAEQYVPLPKVSLSLTYHDPALCRLAREKDCLAALLDWQRTACRVTCTSGKRWFKM